MSQWIDCETLSTAAARLIGLSQIALPNTLHGLFKMTRFYRSQMPCMNGCISMTASRPKSSMVRNGSSARTFLKPPSVSIITLRPRPNHHGQLIRSVGTMKTKSSKSLYRSLALELITKHPKPRNKTQLFSQVFNPPSPYPCSAPLDPLSIIRPNFSRSSFVS